MFFCFFFFFKPFYLFKWLCRILVASWHAVFIYLFIYFLVVSCRIFSCLMQALSCSMWDLVPWQGIKLRPLALGAWSLLLNIKPTRCFSREKRYEVKFLHWLCSSESRASLASSGSFYSTVTNLQDSLVVGKAAINWTQMSTWLLNVPTVGLPGFQPASG